MSCVHTGHSLGGALASLAAHKFAVTARQKGANPGIACYTFGAPRTGKPAEELSLCTALLQSAMLRSCRLHAFCTGAELLILPA